MSPYCYRCLHRRKEITFPLNTKSFKDHNIKMGCNSECIKQVEEILYKNHKTIAAAPIVSP